MNSHKPMGMPGKRNHQLPIQCDMAINSLGHGRQLGAEVLEDLDELRHDLNMMKTRIPTAKVTTVTG